MRYNSSLTRKKRAGAWSPLAFLYSRRVVSYKRSKNDILASLCLASYLAANWLQKLETKHCVYYAEVISVLVCVCVCACMCVCMCVCLCVCMHVCVCVCVVSQFDLSLTKQSYLFVRCQSSSHICNTSSQCFNQPLWKLNLMTGVNMTKQQIGEIKNTI